MKSLSSLTRVLALSVALGTATPILAQEAAPVRRQVVSANPFGLLLELFNAEYERVSAASSTVGVGGSFYHNGDSGDGFDDGGDSYVNADVFYRYYPSGQPLDGWAFGVKAGVTKVTDWGTYAGFGFDTNWSWLLGSNDNFYVGIGFGLKRLFGPDDQDFGLNYLPTFRIVNVGFAF
jgi:hypothetical protein